ncbi:MAG: hypothetical protein O3C57_02750, partial [Verrucomicrobia bacterium]|nr:hypothetical protein [Verrucomicrobiota bacterium]
MLLTAGQSASSALSPIMPRYRLGVGSALFYEFHSELENENILLGSHGTNAIFVVGRETNGTWEVVQIGESISTGPDGALLQVEQTLNLFRLSPDGKVLPADRAPESEAQRNCFMALPANVNDVFTNWSVTWDERFETHDYQFHSASEPEQGKWVFVRTESGPQKALFGLERTASVLFNAPIGLVERMETRFEQKNGDKVSRGAEVTQLRRADILLNHFLHPLIRDLKILKQTQSDYREQMEALLSSDAAAADVLA